MNLVVKIFFLVAFAAVVMAGGSVLLREAGLEEFLYIPNAVGLIAVGTGTMILKKISQRRSKSESPGSIERNISTSAASKVLIDVIVIAVAGMAVLVLWSPTFPAWIALTALVVIAALDFWGRYFFGLGLDRRSD